MTSPPSIRARDIQAVERSAIRFGHDHVLGDVDQTAGQVTGVRRLESGIGQTFTSAVGRDEVLKNRQTFAEVRDDRSFDDFAGRLGHQTAHTGQLTNLSVATSGAGVGHHEDGVECRTGDLLFLALPACRSLERLN